MKNELPASAGGETVNLALIVLHHFGNTMLLRFWQLKNAILPMDFTLAGTVKLVSRHQLNAQTPMLVTLFGIVTLVNPSHP